MFRKLLNRKEKRSTSEAAGLLIALAFERVDNTWSHDLKGFYDILGFMPYKDEESETSLKYSLVTTLIAGEVLAINNLTPNLKVSVLQEISDHLDRHDANFLIDEINKCVHWMNEDLKNNRMIYDTVCSYVFEHMDYEDKAHGHFMLMSPILMAIFSTKSGIWKGITETFNVC
jgi:hypothetical protein